MKTKNHHNFYNMNLLSLNHDTCSVKLTKLIIYKFVKHIHTSCVIRISTN